MRVGAQMDRSLAMKHLLQARGTRVLLAIIVVLATGTAGAVCAPKGEPAADPVLKDLDGQSVKVSEYRGKVVILSFWATWCGRCEEQLEYLRELSNDLSDDVVVLAVNQDTDASSPSKLEEIRSQVKDSGLSFPVLVDAELEMWGDYCIRALPTNLILDRDGRVAFAEPNFFWDSRNRILDALTELGAVAN